MLYRKSPMPGGTPLLHVLCHAFQIGVLLNQCPWAELQVTWLFCLLQKVCQPPDVLSTLTLSSSGLLPPPPHSQTHPLYTRGPTTRVPPGLGLKVFTVPRFFCDPSQLLARELLFSHLVQFPSPGLPLRLHNNKKLFLPKYPQIEPTGASLVLRGSPGFVIPRPLLLPGCHLLPLP